LFRATFLGRTTFGVPLLGMLVSFIGYGVAANNTHRLQGQYDHLRVWSKNRLPAMSLARFEPPRAAANAPGRPHAPVPPGAPVPDASPDTPAVTASPTPTPTQTPTPAPAATVPNPNDNSYFDLNRGWVNMKDASTRPAKGH
jgi:hypothetical protein